MTVVNIQAFRLLSLRGQLQLEEKGMRSSGGPIRPRIFEEFGLKPRDPRETYIAAINAKLEALKPSD